MTEAELHVRPDPRKVADLVDSSCFDNARECWGWLSDATLRSLAEEGRRLAGRDRPRGTLHGAGGRDLLNSGWDGHRPIRMSRPAAAAALGLSASTITAGNA